MRHVFASTLLAGVTAAVSAGLVGTAAAQGPTGHVETVALPGGGIAEIHYTGNIAPRVAFVPGPVAPDLLPAMFGPRSPFAELQRISAAMDRQAASLFREAATLANEPAGLSEAAMRDLPPGSRSFSYIATMSGSGMCARSTTITSQGNGAPPKVVTQTSGNCTATGGSAPGSVGLPTAPAQGPRMMEANDTGPQPYAGLVRPIPIQWER